VQPRRRLGFIAAKLPMASWAEAWVAAYWCDSELTLSARSRTSRNCGKAAIGAFLVYAFGISIDMLLFADF